MTGTGAQTHRPTGDLVAARGGDENAFGRLVEPHRRELHAHCYRMLGSLHDAEDALQDALLRAWRGLSGLTDHGSLRAWLYRIATNTSLDAISRRPKRVLPVDYGSPADPHGGPGEPLVESVWVKVFAPGYGEFYSAHGGDTEAMALAVPTNALKGPLPNALEELSGAANDAIDPARSGNWKSASTGLKTASRAWAAYERERVPPRLASEMERALKGLGAAIDKRDRTLAGTAAIDVARSALDLELRYRPPAEIDLGRFELWANQVLVDGAAGDVGGVRGDVTTMEWIRDRFAADLKPADLTAIDAHLVPLRESVANETKDLKAATAEASELRDPLALGPVKAQD